MTNTTIRKHGRNSIRLFYEIEIDKMVLKKKNIYNQHKNHNSGITLTNLEHEEADVALQMKVDLKAGLCPFYKGVKIM